MHLTKLTKISVFSQILNCMFDFCCIALCLWTPTSSMLGKSMRNLVSLTNIHLVNCLPFWASVVCSDRIQRDSEKVTFISVAANSNRGFFDIHLVGMMFLGFISCFISHLEMINGKDSYIDINKDGWCVTTFTHCTNIEPNIPDMNAAILCW